MCVRLIINVTQVYIPMYTLETLNLSKVSAQVQRKTLTNSLPDKRQLVTIEYGHVVFACKTVSFFCRFSVEISMWISMLDAQRERGAMISSRAPLISTRNFSPRSISFRAAAFRPTNSREIRTVFRLNISSSHSANNSDHFFSVLCAKFIHLHLVG